jgi:hypothetical protein
MASSILIAVLLAVVASIPAVAHAQEGMRKPLSGNSLDVLIEPTLDPDDPHKQNFKVSFLQPGTDTVQVHIDYGFVVKQGDQEIFNAVPPGQALLHTAEGVVTIPVEFPANGDYTIEVSMAGINFVPMNTETATFDVTVVPEFPPAVLGGVLAAVMTTTIVLARYRKLF